MKVVFIASASRSGSTLLDVTLGSCRGFFSAGEVRFIWQRGFLRHELCGCGVPVSDCDFWEAVVSEALGGIRRSEVKAIAELQERVDHPDSFIKSRFFSPARFRAAYRSDVREYLAIMARVYAAAAHISGSEYIIDSSKAPPHGFLLNRIPEVATHTIHLVRDARAVVYSMECKRAVTSENAHLNTYNPYRAALRWLIVNGMYHRLNHGTDYTRIRYEDFSADPRGTVEELLAALGCPASEMPLIRGGRIDLASNHTVSGNPMRFKTGRVDIRPDVRWIESMRASRRQVVTVLTAPLLYQYGYLP